MLYPACPVWTMWLTTMIFMNDGGNYSARPQQLSSETFDADAFTSLDLDVTSGTVEVKHVSGGPVRVIESGRVANGGVAFDAATQNLAEIKGSTLKIRQFDCDDERAIDRTVTVELPRVLPITWWALRRM